MSGYGPGTPLQIPGMPLAGFLPRSANRAAYVAAITAATGQAPGANFGINQFCYHLDLANFIIGGIFTHTGSTPADNVAVFAPSYSLVTPGPSGGAGYLVRAAEAAGGKYYVLAETTVFHPPFPPSASYTISISGPNLVPTSSVTLNFGSTLLARIGMRIINGKIYVYGSFSSVTISSTTYTRVGVFVLDLATLAMLPDTFPFSTLGGIVTDVRGTSTDLFMTGFRSLSVTSGSTAKGVFKFDATTNALIPGFYATFCNSDNQDDGGQVLAVDSVRGFVYIAGNFLEMNNTDPANPGLPTSAITRLDINTGAIGLFAGWPVVLDTLNIDPSSGRPDFFIHGLEVDPLTGTVYVGGYVNKVNGTSFGAIGDSLVFGLDTSGTLTSMHHVCTQGAGGFSSSQIGELLLNNGDLVAVGAFDHVGGVARGSGFSAATATGSLTGFNPNFDGAGLSIRYG